MIESVGDPQQRRQPREAWGGQRRAELTGVEGDDCCDGAELARTEPAQTFTRDDVSAHLRMVPGIDAKPQVMQAGRRGQHRPVGWLQTQPFPQGIEEHQGQPGDVFGVRVLVVIARAQLGDG